MLHISHSQVEQALFCVQQWAFRNVDKLKIPPPIAFIRGRATHRVIEADLTNKKDQGTLLEMDVIRDMARDATNSFFDEEGVWLLPDEKGVPEKELRGSTVDFAVRLSGLHHTELAPHIEPVHLERKFILVNEIHQIELVGVIDIEERLPSGLVGVVDTKTASKTPPKDMSSDQLTCYAMAVEKTEGYFPETRFDFLIDKKTPEVKSVSFVKTQADIDKWMLRVSAVVNQIRSGVVTPASRFDFRCSKARCGYWDRCDFV